MRLTYESEYGLLEQENELNSSPVKYLIQPIIDKTFTAYKTATTAVMVDVFWGSYVTQSKLSL